MCLVPVKSQDIQSYSITQTTLYCSDNSVEEKECGSITIFRKLLEDGINGDKIIEKELDLLVEAPPGVNENSVYYVIKIDMKGILPGESLKQTRILKDLLDLRAKYKSRCEEGFIKLIKHPVLSIFILEKWKRAKYHFYVTSSAFFLFLLSYSMFIMFLFSRTNVCSVKNRSVFYI